VKPTGSVRGVISKLLLGAGGILALIWLRWTPKSGEGIIIYAAVTVGALLTAVVVGNLKDGKGESQGYKPWDSEATSQKDQDDPPRE
jgi:hypothetical protein